MRPTVEGETPASEASSRLDSPTLTLARSMVDCIYAIYRRCSVYAIDYGLLSFTVDPFADGQQRRLVATKKKAIQVILQDDPEAPDCVRAVSLALGLLRQTKQRSWADLAAASAAAEESVVAAMGLVVLLPDQIELVESYEPMLGFIRWSAVGGADKIVTVAVCDRCGRWLLTTSTTPAKCQLTLGCEGALVKASAARRTPARDDDLTNALAAAALVEARGRGPAEDVAAAPTPAAEKGQVA